jgi:hypothetical protein
METLSDASARKYFKAAGNIMSPGFSRLSRYCPHVSTSTNNLMLKTLDVGSTKYLCVRYGSQYVGVLVSP